MVARYSGYLAQYIPSDTEHDPAVWDSNPLTFYYNGPSKKPL